MIEITTVDAKRRDKCSFSVLNAGDVFIAVMFDGARQELEAGNLSYFTVYQKVFGAISGSAREAPGAVDLSDGELVPHTRFVDAECYPLKATMKVEWK